MKLIAIMTVLALMAETAMAETISFENDKLGVPPAGWKAGVTGSGNPLWRIYEDNTTPSGKRVLLQSGYGDYPWCVKPDTAIVDGYVQVKFKPISGRRDQAGGVVWRWKDGDNYYVARANALENNVSLYHTQQGRRITIKYVDAPVEPGRWHTLRVDFNDTSIKVTLNGVTYIDIKDDHIAGTGAVGVWTKADSVTAFDDFSFGKE